MLASTQKTIAWAQAARANLSKHLARTIPLLLTKVMLLLYLLITISYTIYTHHSSDMAILKDTNTKLMIQHNIHEEVMRDMIVKMTNLQRNLCYAMLYGECRFTKKDD